MNTTNATKTSELLNDFFSFGTAEEACEQLDELRQEFVETESYEGLTSTGRSDFNFMVDHMKRLLTGLQKVHEDNLIDELGERAPKKPDIIEDLINQFHAGLKKRVDEILKFDLEELKTGPVEIKLNENAI